MRLFIVTGSFKSTTFINRLVEGLAYSNHQVYIIGKSDLVKKRRIKGVKYLDWGFIVRSPLNIIQNLGAKVLLEKSLIKLFLARNLQGVRAELIRLYTQRYQPDIIHFQWPTDQEILRSIPENTPTILSLRGRLINTAPLAFQDIVENYKQTFPLYHGFHGVSNFIVQEAIKYGASAEKSKVIYSGLDLSKFSFLARPSFKEPLKLISVGRANWIKGYPFAIDACQFLNDFGIDYQYSIIGGKSQETLHHVYDLGLHDKIRLVDQVPFSDVLFAMRQADILLLPSLAEGLANVVLEAMALGTIVISTNCGGMSEVIEDGVNGFLVPPRDSIAIAEKIRTLFQMPNTELDFIRLQARKTIEERHTEIKMVTEMTNLYKEIINNG